MGAESFAVEIQKCVEYAVLDHLRKGDWLTINYADRVKVDSSVLRAVIAGINMDRVRGMVASRVEDHIANSIFNAMATELTNDTKQIMQNKELREDLRAYLRQRMRAAATAVTAA